MATLIETNKYQTPITQELLDQYPTEVQNQFLEFIDTVPLLKWMIGERPRAKDLPRDERGRIIVDVTKPHILEDMDYFRPAAIFYEQNGCYTLLKPNANPNSEFGKWFHEEVRRCREGFVRESDGEWIPGQMYWYLNYCPILLNRRSEKTGLISRIESLPDFWEGIYYRFHYLDQVRRSGQHGMELSRRGSSKSYTLASIMSHNLILGENEEVNRRVVTILTAYLKEYLSDKDGTLSKFTPIIDYLAENTEFPRLMIKRSSSEMTWIMGYKTPNGNVKGSRNTVLGLSVKDDEGKIRGKRGCILFEEMGSYPNFKDVWDNVRDSVREGSVVFSLLYAVGTSGDKDSDFAGVRTMLYNPQSYEIYALPNVYDQSGKGTPLFAYFFPSYISRAECMDKDGNSDVVKALLQILMIRWKTKQGGDAASVMKVVTNMPITPAEAILKVRSNFFPVIELNERLRQLDTDTHAFDDVYVGTLINAGGKVVFRATDDEPIRDWDPKEPNNQQGAIEIFEMPKEGAIPNGRYIIGVDPVDNDQAESTSKFSCFVFDLFTDSIVAEFTGRKPFADDNYEIVRLLAIFYNATILYEANKKGLFSYFSKKHATWMLADCPDYLREKQFVKYSSFGSASKGVTVNNIINSFACGLIKDWLNKTYTAEIKDERGEIHIEEIPQLYRIRNRAFLKELISYGPEVNTDRISAMAQVMLYREHFIILYGGFPSDGDQKQEDVSDDAFFDKDWKKYKKRVGMD